MGGGPTGLVLTATLRQAGHDVLALDRQAKGANDSRAAAIYVKTLEVLRELNVTDRLVAEGVIVPTFTSRDRDRILTRLDFSTLPTEYPFALTLQRYRTEKILTERHSDKVDRRRCIPSSSAPASTVSTSSGPPPTP